MASKHNKRTNSSSRDRQGPPVKKVLLTKSDDSRLDLYASPVTDLIVPNLENPDQIEVAIFKKRSFRHINCSGVVNFRVVDENEIRQRLEYLKDYYKKEYQESGEKDHKTKSLTKHEERLIDATNYILSGTESYNNIAKLTGLKKTEVSALAQRLNERGEILPSNKRREPKVKSQHLEYIGKALMTKNGWRFRVSDLRDLLLKEFTDLKEISLKTLRKAMINARFTHKKITKYIEKRNYPSVKEQRREVAMTLTESLFEAYDIIFVDETGIQFNSVPTYGWGKRGVRLGVRTKPRSRNYTLMTAITDLKVLGCQMIRGSMKSNDYMGFLYTLLKHYEFDKSSKELIIFADNARVHHAKVIKDEFKQKLTLLFNAPYSPMMNPIEDFFSKFKKTIISQIPSNELSLVQCVRNALNTFQEKDLKGYIRHLLYYIEQSLDSRDLI